MAVGQSLGRQSRCMRPAGLLEMRGVVVSSYGLALGLGASESSFKTHRGRGAEEGMGRAGFRMMTLTTKILPVLEVALAIQ